MKVRVFASWTRAFPKYLWKPLAATKFLNSSLPISAMGFEDVGNQARKLSDVSACAPPAGATSWMGRINNFLLTEAYGAVFLSMIADVLVRCMVYLLVPLLALGYCQRARSKNLKFTVEQLKQLSDAMEERDKALLHPDSNFCRVLESALNSARTQASTSGHGIQISSSGHAQSTSGDGDSSVSSASTSKGVKQIPKNGYPESYAEPYDAEHILGILQTTLETSSIADHASTSAEKVQERALKPDIRQRVDHLIRHLQANKEHFKVDGEETVTASSSSNGGDSHIIYIPIQAVVPGEVPSPTSLTQGDLLKKFMVVKLGIKVVKELFSSRILLGSVATTERNLDLLRDFAVQGINVDKGFTLQIGKFYTYHCKGDAKNPVLLSLRDVEVPTILQAEHVAGVLTVRGRFLEGAELRAATSQEYLILQPEKQEQAYPNGIEEWRCYSPVLLSKEPIHIFASKEVCVNKQYLTVRSEAFPMVDNTTITLTRIWVPTTILTIFVLCNLYYLSVEVSRFISLLPIQHLWLPYVGVALVMGILHNLPDRTEIHIGRILNHIKLAFLMIRLAPQALTYSSWNRREIASQATISENVHNIVKNDVIENVNNDVKGDLHGKKDGTKVTKTKITKKEIIKANQENDEKSSDVNKLDWQWPTCKQRYSEGLCEWVEKKEVAEEQHEGSQPFEVIYRSKKLDPDNAVVTKCPKNVVVKIFSKGLQDVLRVLLPRFFEDDENYVEIQAQHLFSLYQEEVLQGLLTSMDTKQSPMHEPNLTWLHMFHLIRFLEQEYESIILQHQRMVTAGVISWDMLWTLIHVNEKVVCYCNISKEELCGKVLSWRYTGQKEPSQGYFEVDLEIWDYDCVSYRPRTIKRRIQEFFQESLISNLDVHPIKFETNVHGGEAFFLKRGKRYHELVFGSERCYLQYRGFMFWSKLASDPKKIFLEKHPTHFRETVDGRVMIDQGAYSKMKSRRYMGTAQPSNGWSQGFPGQDRKLPSESDETLQFCPAVVYGFSFSLRKWGCFLISGLHEITFNPIAFNTLVMKEEHSKMMLLAMTKYYLKKPMVDSKTSIKEVEVDPLPYKGKGCIILLHGPPGTGKTFTVEALAEKIECPLWQLTVSTLAKKPKELETKLVKKFEVAALWGAILLLDEADVYLSSRKYSPLATHASQGNALTGVFLRVLEYYQGILFLTTNEPDSFEPAIDSRISLSIRYEEFNSAQRRQLWSSFMERVGIAHASPIFWKEVLRIQLNGRVIRNIVSNAKLYSVSEGIELNEDHILNAFRVRISTMRYLVRNDEKPESRDVGQDSISSVPSFITHGDDDHE